MADPSKPPTPSGEEDEELWWFLTKLGFVIFALVALSQAWPEVQVWLADRAAPVLAWVREHAPWA